MIKDSDGVSERYWFKTTPNTNTSRLSLIAGGDSRSRREARTQGFKMVGKLVPHAILFDGDYTDFLKTHTLDSSKLIAVSSDGPYGLHAIVIYQLIEGIVSFYCPYENEYYETSADLFMTHAKPKAMFIGDKDSTANSPQCETTSLYETPKRRGYVEDGPQKTKMNFECLPPKKLFE